MASHANGRTVFSSVICGAIGPARVYSLGKIYSELLHFFRIDALMPIITWAIWKLWGTKADWVRLINWPLIFVGTYNAPPATRINYSSWAMVNLIFNWWIKKKYFAWWCMSFASPLFKFSNECKPTYNSEIQLRTRRSSRYGARAIGHHYLLLHYVSRCRVPELVG
jgi:hypothetical protein